MTRIVARNRFIASTVLILGGFVAAANAASGGPVPTVTPTPASYWGVNATFSASGQNYLLVTSDTYNDYYVQRTSSGGYQWSYSKSGSWLNVPSQHIGSTLGSQLAGYFGGAQSPIASDLQPDFSGVTVLAKRWTKDRAITAFTVPAANGGDGTLTYTASGLPAGVTMSSARRISGTPTTVGSDTATVTARDSDGDTDSKTFAWTVLAGGSSGDGTRTGPHVLATPTNVTGMDIFSLLRGTGSRDSSSSATHFRFTVPNGRAGEWTVALDGTPNSGADWDLKGDGGLSGVSSNADERDSVTLKAGQQFDFRVYPYTSGARSALTGMALTLTPPTAVADLLPAFSGVTVPAKRWTKDGAIAAFTVPAATGGNAPLTYTANGLPAGVAMSSARSISGTPTSSSSGTATVTVRDADGDAATLIFAWAVTSSTPQAVLRAAPNPSTDGSYTVSGTMNATAPNSSLKYQLIETGPGGSRSTFSVANPNGIALSFSGKSDGAYVYQMQRCDYYSSSTFTGFRCADLGPSLSVVVRLRSTPPAPGSITGPNTSSDGSYTIAWGRSSGATRYELQESLDGAAWSSVPTTGTSATKAFVGRGSGEYQYRVRACNSSGCSGWSAVKMVLASRPPTAGFDGDYVARSGDLGSDGDTDIYLSPLAVGTGNVGEFILKNDAGTFTLANNPSVAELAAAQTWPLSTQLEVVLEDVNVDGVWDAFVTGVSGTSGFAGAVDQIVVSPATAGAKPTGLVAVDDDLKSFIDSVMAWYRDLDHFDTTVTVTKRVLDGTTGLQQLLNVHLEDCNDEWGSCYTWRGKLADYYGGTAACVIALASSGIIPRNTQGQRVSRVHVCETVGWSFFGIAQVGHTIVDFGSVSDGAVEHVADFVNIWEAGESDHEPEDLADVLEDVLGITIGGYDFSDTSHEDLDESTEQRIFEVHQSLLNMHALFGLAGRRYADDYSAGNAIVTKRRVGGLGWLETDWAWHVALEWTALEDYPALMAVNPTIAAYLRGMLQLKSERNHPSERNNLFAGIVSSTDPSVSAFMWLALVESDRKYRSCPALGYALSREDTNVGKYNSNGFIAGIINSIGATTNAPLGSYYLGNVPVPSSHFESYCPASD